jgi:hypothetical protein
MCGIASPEAVGGGVVEARVLEGGVVGGWVDGGVVDGGVVGAGLVGEGALGGILCRILSTRPTASAVVLPRSPSSAEMSLLTPCIVHTTACLTRTTICCMDAIDLTCGWSRSILDETERHNYCE